LNATNVKDHSGVNRVCRIIKRPRDIPIVAPRLETLKKQAFADFQRMAMYVTKNIIVEGTD
jgi:hypothetical protein